MTGKILSYNQSPTKDENPPEGCGVATIPDATAFLDANMRPSVQVDVATGKVEITGC